MEDKKNENQGVVATVLGLVALLIVAIIGLLPTTQPRSHPPQL